ncbi:MAG: hypothetical protein ACRD2Y_05625, partial [Terriglobales bacterium]
MKSNFRDPAWLQPAPQYDRPVGESDDASWLLLDANAGTVKAKDGNQVYPNLVDTNGNTITVTDNHAGLITATDTVGRQVTFEYIPDASNTSEINYKDSNGVTRTITVNYVIKTLLPTFVSPAGAGNPCTTTPNPNCEVYFISSIAFPNGTSYAFEYNNFGEMTKITYPTGGYTRYDFGRFEHLGAGPVDDRQVIAKHVCTKTTGSCLTSEENTTVYSPIVDGTKTNNQFVDVVDPKGNLTHYEFLYRLPSDCNPPPGLCPLPPWEFEPREVLRQVYDGQTTLLRTVQTCHDNLATCPRTHKTSLPVRITTTLNDTNQVSKVEYDYDTRVPVGSTVSRLINNVTERRAFAYGTGAPGPLLRKKRTNWLKVNPVNSVNYGSNSIHILDRRASEEVYSSAGTLVEQTQFEFDSYTEGLTSTSAVQHSTSYGTSYFYRGNTTASKEWRNTDGAWLVTRHQFDDAGNLRKSVDPMGHATTFSFADSWGNGACAPA